MPRPRLPEAKAQLSGAILKHPERFKDRKEPPAGGPLGAASTYLDESEQTAWEAYRREIPWLRESDRSIVEIACSVRGRMIAGEKVGVSALNVLRSCLSQLGATPTDRSKVVQLDEKRTDPTEEFFDA